MQCTGGQSIVACTLYSVQHDCVKQYLFGKPYVLKIIYARTLSKRGGKGGRGVGWGGLGGFSKGVGVGWGGTIIMADDRLQIK